MGQGLPFESVHRTILGSLSLLGLVILGGVHINFPSPFIDAFVYCHMPSGPRNEPTVQSLAEDCKFSVCGRQPVVTVSFYCHLIWFYLFCFCCGFQEICLLFKFGGAFSYVTLDLHHPIGIVFLATLGTMCHFN
jgi:hypothetical protein